MANIQHHRIDCTWRSEAAQARFRFIRSVFEHRQRRPSMPLSTFLSSERPVAFGNATRKAYGCKVPVEPIGDRVGIGVRSISAPRLLEFFPLRPHAGDFFYPTLPTSI